MSEKHLVLHLTTTEAIICETALSRLLAESPDDALIKKLKARVSMAIVVGQVVQAKEARMGVE